MVRGSGAGSCREDPTAKAADVRVLVVPAMDEAASTATTFAPLLAAPYAASRPAAPSPATTTSASLVWVGSFFCAGTCSSAATPLSFPGASGAQPANAAAPAKPIAARPVPVRKLLLEMPDMVPLPFLRGAPAPSYRVKPYAPALLPE